MARIMSWSVNSGKALDFTEALKYPLCPVLFKIVFPDESKRSAAKSNRVTMLGVSDAIVSNIPQQIDSYILDVMAKIRYVYGKLDTFEELSLKLINYDPKGVNELHCSVLTIFSLATVLEKIETVCK